MFSGTFNLNHFIKLSKFARSLENIKSNERRQYFQNKTVELTTGQPKNLRKILIKAKFEEHCPPPPAKEIEFFLCNDYIYHMDISSCANLFILK